MGQQTRHFYEFGAYRIDALDHLLLRDGEVVPLPPKTVDLLLALVESNGRVLTKEELMKQVWPDSFVEEANLSHHVFTLRKALGEGAANKYIETIPRRGYRFVAGAIETSDEGTDIVLAERTRSRVVIEEESETIYGQGQTVPSPAARRKAIVEEAVAARRSRWQLSHIVLVSAGVAVAIAGAVVYYVTRSHDASRSNKKTALPAMKTIPLTSFPDDEFDPALSPDGKLLAFAWTGGSGSQNINIYVMQTDAVGTPLQLTRAEGREGGPTWSPDGRFIAFERSSREEGGSGIFMIPALGGPVRKLHSGRDVGGLSWSPDGKLIAITKRSSPDDPYGIFLLYVDTLETQKLTSPPTGNHSDSRPVFSPDSQTLAFVRYGELTMTGDLYIVSVGGEQRRLTFENRFALGADWTPDGSSIVFSSDRGGRQSLWRISVSGGEPERLEVDTENAFDPTISRQGDRLAYTQVFSDSNIYRVEMGGSKGHDNFPSRLIASSRRDKNPRLSWDGKRIAFESNRTGTSEIWVADSNGSNEIQLTFFGGAITGSPCWSPDGRQVSFVSRPEGRADIYTINVEGGPPHRLTAGPFNCVAPNWSKDGQWMYFGSDRNGSWQVWKMPTNGGEPFQVTNNGGYEAVESSDSRFIYYNKYGFHTVGIFRIPVEGGQEAMILDLPQLDSFGDWTVTGEGIYFIHRYDQRNDVRGKLASHPAIRFLSFATKKDVEVVALEKDPGQHPGLNVSPDGQWMIYSRVDYRNHDIMLVENFH